MNSHSMKTGHPTKSRASEPQARRVHWRILSEELPILVTPSSSEAGVTPYASATLLMDESAGVALGMEFHAGPPTAEVYERMILAAYARRSVGPLRVHLPDTPAGRAAGAAVKKVIHSARPRRNPSTVP